MKALLVALVFFCTLVLHGHDQIIIQSRPPRIIVESGPLTFNLDMQAGLTLQSLSLSHSSGVSLSTRSTTTHRFFATLPQLGIDALTFGYKELSLSAVHARNRLWAVALEMPSLLLGYAIPLSVSDDYFIHYPSALSAPLFIASLSNESSVASVGLEALWGEGRAVQLSTSLSLFAGPLTLIEKYGPLHQKHSQRWVLAVREGALSLSVGLETVLGEAVIFSGASQSLTKQFFSTFRLDLLPFRLDLKWEQEVTNTVSGERLACRTLGLTLQQRGWSIAVSMGTDGPNLVLTATDRRVHISEVKVESRFVFRRGGLTVELFLDAKARVRWSWRYAIPIGRDSGSPPPE